MVIWQSPTAQAAEAILPIGVRLISMDEYSQMMAEGIPLMQSASLQQDTTLSRKEDMLNRLFGNLDADQSGIITRKEFSNSYNGKAAALFNALDSDKNHVIERYEIENYSALYVRLGRRS